MAKKLSLLMGALVVLAFAIPAAANAAPGITKSGGTLASVGQEFNLTGNDFTLTSATVGPVTCKTLDLKGKISKNNGVEFEATGVSAFTASGCAFTVTNFELTQIKSTSSGKLTMNFVATIDIDPLECTYTGTNIAGSYTPGSDTIVFSSSSGVTSTPIGCGTAKVDGEFTMEIGSTAVILD